MSQKSVIEQMIGLLRTPIAQRKGINIPPDECLIWAGELEKELKSLISNSNEVQKSADKVEPKFHKGDWIVFNGLTLNIKEVVKGYYRTTSIDGIPNSYDWDIDNVARLWTIKDAKDGDVLYFSDETIVIFKDLYNTTTFHSYCHIEDGLFGGSKDEMHWWESKGFKPATKEQRDLLFQKMHEAGYEWDADSKELNKFEEEEYNGEDYGIDSLYHAQRILEKTLGKVDGYQTDDGILSHQCAITAVKKLYEHKSTECIKFNNEFENQVSHLIASVLNGEHEYNESFVKYAAQSLLGYAKNELKPIEWSEEDDVMVHDILGLLPVKTRPEYNQRREDWLKSLKSRVQPQEWNEEDYNKILSIKYLLHELDNHNFDNWLDSLKCKPQYNNSSWSEEDEKMFRSLHNLIYVVRDCDCDSTKKKEFSDWIESLKSRYQSKQEQEWDEEDEGFLNLLLSIFTNEHPNGVFSTGNIIPFNGNCVTSNRIIDWLKSLKDKVYQKQELCEEDEDMVRYIGNAITCKESAKYLEEKGIDMIKAHRWLESFKPQLKQEWSEHDETMKNHALQIINKYWNSLPDTDYDENEISESCYNWLKSLEQRIGWKPSEEQMMALSEAPGIVGMFTPRGTNLQSLYNDLKKL